MKYLRDCSTLSGLAGTGWLAKECTFVDLLMEDVNVVGGFEGVEESLDARVTGVDSLETLVAFDFIEEGILEQRVGVVVLDGDLLDSEGLVEVVDCLVGGPEGVLRNEFIELIGSDLLFAHADKNKNN